MPGALSSLAEQLVRGHWLRRLVLSQSRPAFEAAATSATLELLTT